MTLIRPFRQDEIHEIEKIAKKCLKENYSTEVFLTIYKANNTLFLVALEDEELIAFLTGIVESPQGGRLLMIAVLPRYRRRGIGTFLLDRYLEVCNSRGTKIVNLEVRPSNRMAIKFYIKHGFTPQGIIDDFYADGEKCMIMVKYL